MAIAGERRFATPAAAVLAAILAAGCVAAGRPLAAEGSARIREETNLTAVVYRPPPAFRQRGKFDEQWDAALGPVGAAATESGARSAGEQMRARLGLEDPAFVLRDRVVAAFARERGISRPFVPQVLVKDDVDALVQALGPSGINVCEDISRPDHGRPANPG